jgi:hypothetical protein
MNLLRPMPRVQQGIGMVVGGLVRKIAVISAVAGLCAASAGCVSDFGAQTDLRLVVDQQHDVGRFTHFPMR